MAHLQCEGYRPDLSLRPPPPPSQQQQQRSAGGRGWRSPPQPPPPADLGETLAFLAQLTAGRLPAMSAAAATAAQQQQRQRQQDGAAASAPPPPPADLGVLLWGFFNRFGALSSCKPPCSLPPPPFHPPAVLLHANRLPLPPPAPAPSPPPYRPVGLTFSYSRQAVSTRMGGVCLKVKAWRRPTKPWLLAVEDPQEMGKDIGGGSYNIRGERSGQPA